MPSMNVLRKPALNGLIVLFLSLTLILTPEANRTRAAGATPQSLIQVTTSADELNNDGDCSLREAIRAANLDVAVDACPAGSGADRINLPAGMYLLSIPGQDENAALTGDLDITADLTIVGEGKERTFVDANQIDRVFHVTGPYAVQFSSLTIQNGVTTTALYGGGGVLNESGGILTIANVDLLNNTSSETGGALDNAGIATLFNVTIQDNSAKFGGGIFNGGTLNMTGATLTGNSAVNQGGGLDNNSISRLTNVTFSENTAPEGGGIFSDFSVYLYSCTFNGNSMAIFLGGGEGRFKNTIVAGSSGGDNCSGTGAIITLGYNLDSGTSCAFNDLKDLTGTSPLLAPLQDNGGLTFTHALLSGSPAIDAGENLDCPPTDQRGAPRPTNGDEDPAVICDIGAYESNSEVPVYRIFLPAASR